MTVKVRMTKKDFKHLPEGPPYYEFEHGEVIELPKPHPWHHIIVGELFHWLRRSVLQHNLGLVFTGEITGVPDLVVEIVSLTHQDRDRPKIFEGLEVNLLSLVGEPPKRM